MMNMIPGKLNSQLASPFMLVHGTKPYCWSWLPLFSVCYFHTTKDGNITRSKNQVNAMDGVAVRRSPTLNALLVYNPQE